MYKPKYPPQHTFPIRDDPDYYPSRPDGPAAPEPPSSCSSVHPPETERQIPGAPCSTQPRTPAEPDPYYQWLADERHGDQLGEHQPLATMFRHSGWKGDRRRVFQAFGRTQQPFARQTNFRYCGAHSYVLRNIDDPSVYRIAGSSCHDRFCIPCSSERSRSIALNVIDHAEGKRLRFITLTLKANDQLLGGQLDRLYTAFQALRRRKFWTARCFGGVAFLELTWNAQTSQWHPHLHILVEGSYLAQQGLKKLWYQLTGDSYIVDVRAIRDASVATRYVTKYASKPLNPSFTRIPDRLDEAIRELKGRKLCLTFGTWRGLSLSPKPCDGAWEHIAPLEAVIEKASHGDSDALEILRTLSDTDMTPLLAQAFQRGPPKPIPVLPVEQLTFFGVWNREGTWNDPV